MENRLFWAKNGHFLVSSPTEPPIVLSKCHRFHHQLFFRNVTGFITYCEPSIVRNGICEIGFLINLRFRNVTGFITYCEPPIVLFEMGLRNGISNGISDYSGISKCHRFHHLL